MKKTLTLLVKTGTLSICLLQGTAIYGPHATAAAILPVSGSLSSHFGADMRVMQDVTLTGKVLTDGTTDGLPGVTVVVTPVGGGSKQGATTDENGVFTISSLQTGVRYNLEFSYIGFEKQSLNDFLLTESNNSSIEIKLKESTSNLSEVVVVGYGTTVKKDITGSVKSLKSSEFNTGIINSPEQLLQGKVSGVNITSATGEPGAKTSITVRGPGGIRTGSTPLLSWTEWRWIIAEPAAIRIR
jgi:hypothetical protein